jgi:hypothetical protein
MDNPYQAPEADLGSEASKPKSKKGWKIFFWVMVTLQLLLMVSTFIDPIEDKDPIENFIDFVIYPITILGIFGFAYSKSLISSSYWKIWIVIALVTDSYSFFSVFATETVDASGLELYLYIGTILAILVPILVLQYFCLYNYAFKSPEIWQKPSKK